MKPGPAPKPSAMRTPLCNPSKRPLNENEPVAPPVDVLHPAPDHLNAAGKVAWARMVPLLTEMRVLTAADLDLLGGYCAAFARWSDAEKHIAEDGPVVKAPSGYPIQNPYLAVANKALDQMRQIGGDFGLTPSARTRLVAAPKEKEKKPVSDAMPMLKIAR
jgi:P27 family predicted phage terminase small subunit